MRFFGKGLLAAIRRIHPELYHVVKCGGAATEDAEQSIEIQPPFAQNPAGDMVANDRLFNDIVFQMHLTGQMPEG